MEYLIGVVASLGVAAFAAVVGFDRERSFYPTVMIVIASYYILFAVMNASRNTLLVEILVACVFTALAVLGYRTSAWFVVAALVRTVFLTISTTWSLTIRECRAGGRDGVWPMTSSLARVWLCS